MENEELVRSPDVYKVPSPGLVYGQQGMPDHPSPTLRCPLPQVTVTPDSLRQFNRNGRLPQIRLLTPETLSNSGGGSGTVINNTGAGSGTTVNNNTIIASGSNNPPGPSSPTAQNASVTTPLLNPGDQYLNPIPIAKAFAILLISVSSAARVEVYTTALLQASDVGRSNNTPPAAGTQHGVIVDLYLDTPDKFSWIMSPIAMGCNNDSPQSAMAYITVTNIGAGSAPISVSILYVPEEN